MSFLEVYGATYTGTGFPRDLITAIHTPPGGWSSLNTQTDSQVNVYDFGTYFDYLAALHSGQFGTALVIRKAGVWSKVSLPTIKFATKLYVRGIDDILLVAQSIAVPNIENLYHWNGTNLALVRAVGNLLGAPYAGLSGYGADYVLVVGTYQGAYKFTGGDVRTAGNWVAISRPGQDTNLIVVVSPTEAYAGLYYYSGVNPSAVWRWNGSAWSATGPFPSAIAGSRCFAICKAADGKIWAAGSANPTGSGSMLNTGTYVLPVGGSWQVNKLYGSERIMFYSAAAHRHDPEIIVFGGRLSESPGNALYLEYLDGVNGVIYSPNPSGPLPTGALDLRVAIPQAVSFPTVEDGGYKVEIAGSFPIGTPLEIFIGPNGNATDNPVYGGQGYGYLPQSIDGNTVTIITPPLPVGVQYLSWRTVGGSLNNWGEVAAKDRHWQLKTYHMRASFPPWMGVGPRRLAGEEP